MQRKIKHHKLIDFKIPFLPQAKHEFLLVVIVFINNLCMINRKVHFEIYYFI